MQVLEKYFDTAFDAPDGIKKLRELILTLAMQGKLVQQDPNDQPASELLKEIEKDKQITNTANNKKKILVIKSNKEPYSISKSWEWVKLEDVSMKIHYGFTASANFDIKTPKLLRITDIQDNKVEWENVPGGDIEENKINQYLLSNNDILIARTGGTIGKSYLIENINLDAIFASYLIRVIPSKHINPKFLKLFIESPLYWKQLYLASSGTGQPNVNGTSLSQLDLPLPPLNEQKRIVEKINQLMALCDELEKLKEQKEAKKLTVHKSAINQLLDSKDDSNSQKGWHFISNHFNDLYTVKENVSEFRSAILQLAMQGKLVPQDPNEQPASELLKEIDNEKQQLIKKGKIKKLKPFPLINDNEKLFEIPNNWKWVRFNDVLDVRDGTHDTPSYVDAGYPLVTSKNLYTGVLDFSNVQYISEEDHAKISERSKVDKGDILFAMIGSIGNPAIVDTDIEFSIKNVALFKYYNLNTINNQYLYRYLLFAQEKMKIMSSGAVQKFVSLGLLRSFLLPLPPLNEQKRIVEKINQLMTLCDNLEKQIENSSAKQTQLLNAIISNLGK